MNESKLNRGRARLVHWLEDAANLAANGGGVYIAATRDGLRANGIHANEEDAVKIFAVVQWIQGRVEANNVAHNAPFPDATMHAPLIPNPELAREIQILVKKLRRQFGFGDQPIQVGYAQPVKIGGVPWMTWTR